MSLRTTPKLSIFALAWWTAQTLLLVLVMSGSFTYSTSAQVAENRKNILVLFSDDPSHPAQTIFEQSLRSTIKNGSPVPVEFYSEYLDALRTNAPGYEKEFASVLQRKYDGKKFDLIVSVSSAALKFLQNQTQIFPDTPIVFWVLDEQVVKGLKLPVNMTGRWSQVNFRTNLDLALNLNPNTRKVMVIGGVSEFDKYWIAKAREDLRPYEGTLEITYLLGLTLSELKGALAKLPPQTVAMFVTSTRDNAGTNFNNPEVLSQVSLTSKAPIYGCTDVQLGKGILGGSLMSFETIGLHMGNLGLRVLSGEKPQSIANQAIPSVPMFDWRELRRWGISQEKLPAGSIVRFQEPTFWEQYKWRIIGAVSLMILQTIFIFWLLINRAKRRKAEETSRLNEERYRNVVDTQSELICRYRPDGTLTFVNDAYCRYFGKTRDQLIETKFTELLPEHARDAALSYVASLIENPRAETYEHEVLLPNGTTGWQQWVDHVVENNGHGIELQGIGRDVTEKRRAEEELRLSEARFKHMADTAPVLIWMADQNKLCTYFNQLCMDFTGLKIEQLLGEGWLEIVHDDDKQRCIDIYTAAYDRSEPFVYEYRVRHADGQFHWLYNTAAPRFAANGELIGYIGSCVDITDRKLAEDAVRESEERFRVMADTSTVLIWIADVDMMVTYFNQRILDFTGRTMEQLFGEGWLEIVHEDDRQRCVEAYTEGYEQKEPFILEYRLRRADGEYRWLYDTGAPRFASNGEFLGYIGSAVDIHDRRSAEEALQSAHDEVNKLKNQLEAENLYLQEEIKLTHNVDEIVGESNAIKYVLFKIEQVAQTDTSVLILGETGTGKELVARALHSQSTRKDRPLVKVNCAALSSSLIESELFGHEKGAFTGAASRKIGRFELADGATIFLDEIGELPLELQPKLLRVIQEGELERLGSSKTIKVDVRLIAATNRNLKLEVEKGNFREDLWYRLNVFPITLPPLRQRKEDIPLMVEHFASVFSKKVGKTISSISSATMKKFEEHSWPGNVRELSNVVERALVTTQGAVLHVTDQFEQPKAADELAKTLEDVERDHIARVLDLTSWRVEGPSGAARILGINPSTLRTRMGKLGIQKSIKTSAGGSTLSR